MYILGVNQHFRFRYTVPLSQHPHIYNVIINIVDVGRNRK